MTEAPKRIWAWPHFDGWITGDWSANTYHDERTVAYILAAEHDRLMAEKDAEIERLREALGAELAAARNQALDDLRALVIEDEEGVGDTLTVGSGYGKWLCEITIYEPWQGDTESGFGAQCTFSLTREQVARLVDHLKLRLMTGERRSD